MVETIQPDRFSSLRYRNIGPTRGGRVVAVAGDPVNRSTFYMGSTGGGVWKTEDGGKSWMNVSDGYFNTASVGALTVAPSDPNVIYAGMGETSIRGNVSKGDGVYKSTDAGKSWTHIGLENTQNIGEIVVHPQDPDLVYVAALGHVFGSNPERGVYRSKDGGQTWELVLHKSDKAGAVDLSMDPNNPRIIYATIWEALRGPYFMSSGGEDSGLYRSFDGGDTWEEISRNTGLPKEGVLGKIGVAASGAKPGRLWAIVEHENGAVFRSDDYGDTWTRLSEDRNLRQRAWYYHHIYADPTDENTVFVLNVGFWKSVDGGKTFTTIPVQHGDTHDLWIDPNDNQRMILGDDGGAEVTFEGGANWSPIENQATAEFYHVVTDGQTPYRVFGAQQDNSTISVPSRSNGGAIARDEWEEVGGGESGYIAVKPDDPNIIFAGSYGGLLTRYDRRTRLRKTVSVWPEMTLGSPSSAMKYRFQWTSPTVFSRHNPDILYHGGNHIFRSDNLGESWQEISDDLTRGDPETMGPSGGPITKDNTGVETYATVFAIEESPIEQGTIWAGSDDGLIHVTRDGGETWQNVTPGPDLLPEWSLISIVEPSHHDPAVAYIAATRYKSHDDKPYLLKTTDSGESWSAITNGIPENQFTRVIREDPECAGLLFAGTERGLWVSFDAGDNWQPLQLNLPVTPIHDMLIEQGDLVVATHGRCFWILDDISPLRQLKEGTAPTDGNSIFQPRPTIRWAAGGGFRRPPSPGLNFTRAGGLTVSLRQITKPDGELETVFLDGGENPPSGVVFNYFLTEKPKEDITLTIKDAGGNEVRTYSSAKPKDADYKDKPGLKKPTPIPAKQGANRFVWDLRYPAATEVPDDTGSMGFAAGVNTGPRAVPGTYTAELKVGNQTLTQEFEIVPDPRLDASQDDLQAAFDLVIQARDTLSKLHEGVNTIRSVRKQVDSWSKRLDDEEITKAGDALKEKLQEIEDEVIQHRAKSAQDTLNFPVLLNAKLAALIGVVDAADGKPTQQSYDLYEDLKARTDTAIDKLDTILTKDLAALNTRIQSTNTPAIEV